VLTQAVTGKLTEEWREGKELEEWKEVKLGNYILEIKAGKNFNCPEMPVVKGKVGLVKISAVTWGKFNEEETKTVEDETRIDARLFIKAGDFLISRANTLELVGASLIVDKIENDIMLSDKIWRVRFEKSIIPFFIDSFLKSSKGRSEIESRAVGNQLSMRNISQNSFKDIDIPLPTLEEQKEMVRRVESLFAKADAIEKQYQTLKQKIDSLPQALLAKAFKGELVEQLESDGSAEELLKEIQKAKAGLTKSTKKLLKNEIDIAAERVVGYGK
jgi:type I restriction enzyme S subunit